LLVLCLPHENAWSKLQKKNKKAYTFLTESWKKKRKKIVRETSKKGSKGGMSDLPQLLTCCAVFEQ
jgi:hypothetical protein